MKSLATSLSLEMGHSGTVRVVLKEQLAIDYGCSESKGKPRFSYVFETNPLPDGCLRGDLDQTPLQVVVARI